MFPWWFTTTLVRMSVVKNSQIASNRTARVGFFPPNVKQCSQMHGTNHMYVDRFTISLWQIYSMSRFRLHTVNSHKCNLVNCVFFWPCCHIQGLYDIKLQYMFATVALKYVQQMYVERFMISLERTCSVSCCLNAHSISLLLPDELNTRSCFLVTWAWTCQENQTGFVKLL